MKILLSSLLVALSITSSSSQCMEAPNNNIGPIDRLMLERAIQERGYNNLAQEIENHAFTSETYLKRFPPIPVLHHHSFLIVHQCTRNDGSKLSRQVFTKIVEITHLDAKFTSKNPLNQASNSLDECTTWAKTQNSDVVHVTTDFYDKAALVALLNQLQK